MSASGEDWEIRFYLDDKESPLGICATGEHAHSDWQKYRECYSKARKEIGLKNELLAIRGAKSHPLCWLCIDIFTDHEEAQCPQGSEQRNPPLLALFDHLSPAFVQFIGTMAGHTRGTLKGSCPLCQWQEKKHNYVKCLRGAHITVQEGMLKISTKKECMEDPNLDPNPPGPMPGPMPGTTPKSPPKPPPQPTSAKSGIPIPIKGRDRGRGLIHTLFTTMYKLCWSPPFSFGAGMPREEEWKNWKSVRITHAGSWMVCKQNIILNHVLSEKMHFWSQLLTDFHIWPTKSKLRTSSTR